MIAPRRGFDASRPAPNAGELADCIEALPDARRQARGEEMRARGVRTFGQNLNQTPRGFGLGPIGVNPFDEFFLMPTKYAVLCSAGQPLGCSNVLQATQGDNMVSRGELYSALVQMVNNAESISWNRFYNFLMGNSILVLAWATIYASQDRSTLTSIVLSAICVFGAGSGIVWAALGK
jgi:hypothetical protein